MGRSLTRNACEFYGHTLVFNHAADVTARYDAWPEVVEVDRGARARSSIRIGHVECNMAVDKIDVHNYGAVDLERCKLVTIQTMHLRLTTDGNLPAFVEEDRVDHLDVFGARQILTKYEADTVGDANISLCEANASVESCIRMHNSFADHAQTAVILGLGKLGTSISNIAAIDCVTVKVAGPFVGKWIRLGNWHRYLFSNKQYQRLATCNSNLTLDTDCQIKRNEIGQTQ